jgi:hypothetical protein
MDPLSLADIGRSLVGPVGFVAGLYVRKWVDRARPTAQLEGAQFSVSAERLQVNIPISDDLLQSTVDSPWLRSLQREELAPALWQYAEELKQYLRDYRSAAKTVEHALSTLPMAASGNIEQKRSLIRLFVENGMIDGAMTVMLARREIPLDSARDYSGSQKIFAVSESDQQAGGFMIDYFTGAYYLTYRDKSFNDRLQPAALAMAYFDVEQLRTILEHVKRGIESVPVDVQSVYESVRNLIDRLIPSIQHLTVRAIVSNRGASPFTIAPWAALRILSTGGNFAGAVLLLERRAEPEQKQVVDDEAVRNLLEEVQQGGRYGPPAPFVVSGNSAVLVEYESKQSMSDIKDMYPQLAQLIESQSVDARISIQRMDAPRWWPNTFIDSPVSPVGRPTIPREQEDALTKHAKRLGHSFR